MTNLPKPESSKEAKGSETLDFGAALAMGITLGLIFGTMLGNTAMGLTAGLLLATLVNAYYEKKHSCYSLRKNKRAGSRYQIVEMLVQSSIREGK